MLTQTLTTIFVRDLKRLKTEIASYKTEALIWAVDNSITNSAGNLCLHLIGNLNAYIGAEIGKSGYIRHRDLEFSLINIPKAELLSNIDETIAIIEKSLPLLTEEDLQKEYGMMVLDATTSTEYFLVHLTAHLSYHLGQINYHRRLLDV